MADNKQNTEQKKTGLSDTLGITDPIKKVQVDALEGELKKQVKEQTTGRLQGGQSPEDILNDLLGLAKTQVGTGEKTGIITSLLKGKGLSRPEITEPLGLDAAVKVLGLQQQAGRGQREEQLQPGKLGKQRLDILQGLTKLGIDTNNPAILEEVNRTLGKPATEQQGETIERDVFGRETTKGLTQKKSAEVRASKVEAQRIKKEALKKDLDTYFAIGDELPTADGLNRFLNAADLKIKGITQDEAIGSVVADLQAINKRLRVTLVRAAGDVGNLNIVEQEAAEKLLFNLSDSTSLRTIKKAVLKDLTRAVNDGSTSDVRKLMKKWKKSGAFKKQDKVIQNETRLQNLGLDPNKFEIVEE